MGMNINFQNADFEKSAVSREHYPKSDMLEFAFAGRSNVGKSSLINKLLNRKSLARVSGTPGKTITINFYNIDNCIYLVDLPGYGYAKVSKSEQQRWADLMDGYFKQQRDIRLVVQLIDSRHAPTALDLQMLGFLADMELPFVIALTKTDKLKKSELEKRLSLLPSEIDIFDELPHIVLTSSEKGIGIDELREIITDCCN